MVPFQGVIAILLGCLTFFQWLRPEDEPDSRQEIDPWREWNGGPQMGMSVHSAEDVCVCVSLSLCSLVKDTSNILLEDILFPPLSKPTKYFTACLFLHFFKPMDGSAEGSRVVFSGTEQNGVINYLVSADLRKEPCWIDKGLLVIQRGGVCLYWELIHTLSGLVNSPQTPVSGYFWCTSCVFRTQNVPLTSY